MKYPYIVNCNGKWYEAGADVPVSSSTNVAKTEEKAKAETNDKTAKYSKTDIQRMSTEQLKALAVAEGIDNAEETSGNQLKKMLVEHFGL